MWLLAAALAPAMAQEGATVVVLDVDGADSGLSDEERAGMSDRLAGIMKDSGKYNVIAREDFQAAVALHEKETGQPCQDQACQLSVAKSMGAQGVVQPKVERSGSGCAVSMGVTAGADSEPVAGSTVKNKCSLKSLSVAMDGAMLGMTHKLVTENPLEVSDEEDEDLGGLDAEPGQRIEIVTGTDAEALHADDDAARESAQDAEEKAAGIHGDTGDDQADGEGGDEGAQQGDPEAEARGRQMEKQAAKKLGF
jgi:hypothetical protein